MAAEAGNSLGMVDFWVSLFQGDLGKVYVQGALK
jgi:hypothetical protein